MRRAMGRPTKYDPAFCDRVMEMGADGMAIIEWCAELDVTRQTLHNWRDTHPEFLEAYTRAVELSEAWWTSQARAGLHSRDFNTSLFKHQMATRFAIVERQELQHSGALGHYDPGKLTDEQLQRIRDGEDPVAVIGAVPG